MTAHVEWSFLFEKLWNFGRADGTIISRAVRLLPSGELINHAEPNEHRWALVDNNLVFVDRSGNVSTCFDHIETSQDGRIVLSGIFLLNPALEVTHVLSEANIVASSPRIRNSTKVAVLVRTHKFTLKLQSLIEALSGSPLYDLFIIADETRGPLRGCSVPKIGHSINDCAAMGLNIDHPNILWACGDYPIYVAANMLPEYEYFVQIEYDVHFTRNNPLYIEGLINRLALSKKGALDYLAPRIVSASPDWPMGHSAKPHFGMTYYGGIFAFVLLSRRAIDYLFQLRIEECSRKPSSDEVMHCEVFVPSAIMNNSSLNAAGIVEVLPGTVERRTFHPGSETEPNYILNQVVTSDPRIEMIHPVFDYQEYYGREITRAVSAGTLVQLEISLGDISETILSPTNKAEIASWIRERQMR